MLKKINSLFLALMVGVVLLPIFSSCEKVPNKMIDLKEVAADQFTFAITYKGSYKFLVVKSDSLTKVSLLDCLDKNGLLGSGKRDYQWIDDKSFQDDAGKTIEMDVDGGTKYTILAAPYDVKSAKISGEVQKVELETKPVEFNGKVKVEVSNITSTGMTYTATPASDVVRFIVLVKEESWFLEMSKNFEALNSQLGQGFNNADELIAYLVEHGLQSGMSKEYTEAVTADWSGLKPERDYRVAVVVEDFTGKTIEYTPFTTSAPTGRKPELKLAITNTSGKLELNIKSDELAYIGVYVFMTRSELDYIQSSGKTIKEIVQEKAVDFNTEEIAQIKSAEGYNMSLEDLYPGMEYSFIVAIRTLEDVEVYEVVQAKLDGWPSEPKVQSELFTALQGQWKMSYKYNDYLDNAKEFKDVIVNIVDGFDDASRKDYSERNLLVLTHFPFQENNDEYPFYSPDSLKKYNSLYKNSPDLAERDYGAKIFFHIGEGDVVTVPTHKSVYLLNWTSDNVPLNFWGVDIKKEQIAPAHFPVEISSDRKTITIKELVSGPEFSNGTYRPCVMESGAIRCVATSDIVLTKVEK